MAREEVVCPCCGETYILSSKPVYTSDEKTIYVRNAPLPLVKHSIHRFGHKHVKIIELYSNNINSSRDILKTLLTSDEYDDLVIYTVEAMGGHIYDNSMRRALGDAMKQLLSGKLSREEYVERIKSIYDRVIERHLI